MVISRITTFPILFRKTQIWIVKWNAWFVCIATKVKKVSFIVGDNRRWMGERTDTSQRQQQTRFTPLKSLAISDHL